MTPQLSLFDDDYLPLRAAENFGFDLPYIVTDSGTIYFRLLSWLEGCVGEKQAVQKIRDMRNNGSLQEMRSLKQRISPVLINTEKDSMNRDQQFEYVTDELLYRITQDLRATKDRPVVMAIKDYLAKAGAFVDKTRRDAMPLIEPPKNRAERVYLDQQIVEGRLTPSEAKAKLQTRRDTKSTYKEMMQAISEVVAAPNYARIADSEYVSLFGHTAKELKALLDTDSIRDALTDTQLTALQFFERAMRDLVRRAEQMTNAQVIESMRKIAAQIQLVLIEVESQIENLSHKQLQAKKEN